VRAAEYQAYARAKLLAAWRLKARDPDDQPETRFSSGTSAGVRVSPLDCGVLPMVHNAHGDPELLGNQEPKRTGASREVDAGAMSEFNEYGEKHFVKAFTTCADMTRYLGGVQPVLSDVRVVAKMRGDHTKRRILLGREKAGSTRSSQCVERTTHPRVSDAVNCIRELSAAKPLNGFRSDVGVLDFPDAVWPIPFHHWERGALRRQTWQEMLRLATHGAGRPWSAACMVEM